MVTREELESLFADLESDRVERKENANDGDRVRQAICALANDLPNHRHPGVIFLGQKDDGSCANLRIDDRLLQKVGGWRSDGNLQPFPVMHIRTEIISGCEVVVIVVEPTENPPIKLDGRVWIRVGPRRAVASVEEERRLVEKRRWGTLPFDAHGVPGATIDDLDLRVFEQEYLPASISPEILKEDGRSLEEKLRALRFMRPDGLPTNTAILIIGKNPRAWVPGSFIQFLRIDGTDLADPLKNERTIDGTLGEQIRGADELLNLSIERKVSIESLKRTESVDYPQIALRQLLRNAILHRVYEGSNAPVRITWYSDRVEIQNPGGPYGQVTRENFGQPGITDYRNPTIAEAIRNLRYVERFGVGIATARRALAENGNPPLEFRIEDQHVHVTVRRSA